jgi:YVTN family beta-propeller protein
MTMRATVALIAHATFATAAGAAAPSVEGTLVVLNKAEATASLIDLASRRVVATLDTGAGPHEAAVSPDGRTVVVANYGTREAPGSSLTVLDVPAARIEKTIDLGQHRRPHGVSWLSDGRRAVVTVEDSKALLVVDMKRGRVESAIRTNQEVSHMVAVSARGDRAYVANIGSGSVSVVDLARRSLVTSLATGAGAEGIALSSDGRSLFVTNREADTVSVVDTDTLKVIATIEVPAFPIRAALIPGGGILVSCARSGDLALVDPASHVVVRRIPMALDAESPQGRLFGDQFGKSPVPIGIVVRPDSRVAWVANANADAVAVIDLESFEVTGVLKAGREPDGMAWTARTVKGG